jgi:hypothetical protein
MQACGQQPVEHRQLVGGQPPVVPPLQQPGVPTDANGNNHAAGTSNATSLAQRLQTISRFDQVVQRPEQQRDVDAVIGLSQRASIAHRRRESPAPQGLRDMFLQRIDQLHVVPVGRQPPRMDARRSADIQHSGGRLRQVTPDQLLRPEELQLPVPAAGQPVVLDVTVAVELLNGRIHSSMMDS